MPHFCALREVRRNQAKIKTIATRFFAKMQHHQKQSIFIQEAQNKWLLY
jgi:hypothetical protein